jgi:serine protease AprX
MDPLDDNGHGSHCAGTIAGTTYGVAPEAQILAVKVLSGSGSGSWQSVADGVQFVADYKDAKGKRVDVASMSLGGGAPIQAVLRTAFDNAVKLGVIFAIAAGNSGPSAKTIGTPGDQKDIVSVGATDINDNIASFSSRGPVVAYGDSYIKPDISAPGVNITSCWKGSATASNTISGTSMATPHVAGLMALIMQAKTGLKFEQMKSILETTALDLGAAGLDTSFGWGRVQADKAVETAEMLASRMDIEKDVNFPINPDGTISMNLTKENPLWEMKATVSVTILNPEGIYNGTFSLIKNGKNTQKGAINNLPAGQLHNVGTFTLYYGENTLQLEGTYTGESKVAEGTLRVKATLQD